MNDLIKNVIVEDEFKARYTARQRSIICKNIHKKMEEFILKHEPMYLKAHTHLLHKAHEEEKEVLLQEIKHLRISNEKMRKCYLQGMWTEVFFLLMFCIWCVFVYYEIYLFLVPVKDVSVSL
jgi:hypothetical protein